MKTSFRILWTFSDGTSPPTDLFASEAFASWLATLLNKYLGEDFSALGTLYVVRELVGVQHCGRVIPGPRDLDLGQLLKKLILL